MRGRMLALLVCLACAVVRGQEVSPGPFSGRIGAERDKLVRKYGGTAESQAAVAEGLRWLALHQADDGHWSMHEFNKYAREKPLGQGGKVFTDNCGDLANRNDDIAGTAFGLLPFLGAGISGKSKEPAALEYNATVEAGLKFLMAKQGADGSLGVNYTHALATIALCEAFGLTRDPKLANPCVAATTYIANAQDPNGGGWRYAPGQAGDLSVTGYMLSALKTAQVAGVQINPKVFQSAAQFVTSCEVGNQWSFSYTPAGGGSTPTMSACGLQMRMHLGKKSCDPEIMKGLPTLEKAFQPNHLYFHFHATPVVFHIGGDPWRLWNEGGAGAKGLRERTVAAMDRGDTPGKAEQKGSWKPDQASHIQGRLMATSLNLLNLEIYYRYPRYEE